jgi:hypothetical protein
MFRLHIDIPMQTDEATATALTEVLVTRFGEQISDYLRDKGITEMNYRLGHDDDRQKSNYLIKTESGHVANKKSRMTFVQPQQDTTDG